MHSDKTVETNQLPQEFEDTLELVFGFVGPTGVDLDLVCELLEAELEAVKYESRIIRLSKIIEGYRKLCFNNYYDKITMLIDEGNNLRKQAKRNEILAAMGVAGIKEERKLAKTNRIAYLVRSFKRHEEVNLFREIYDKAFILISIYSPRSSRIDSLKDKCHSSISGETTAEELAIRLEKRDQKEEGVDYGQRVSRTFPMADYFVDLENRTSLSKQLHRLVRLTFGDPYISPTKDEEGMFFAQAAGFRSLDLSRQVGAAIVSKDGEILATGCNDVPKFNGGLYWGDDIDCMRDFEKGFDSNVKIKSEIIEDLIKRLREAGILCSDQPSDEILAKQLLFDDSNGILKDSKMFDIIEFGRAVHAEMSAIMQASKIGTSIYGSRLYCTTFPCHICSRHIIASGISEVVFIEPYEKSRTRELYSDSTSIESPEKIANKLSFKAFVGVAPRRYMDCFQLVIDRKNKEGKVLKPSEIFNIPRIKKRYPTYRMIEDKVIETLDDWLPKDQPEETV